MPSPFSHPPPPARLEEHYGLAQHHFALTLDQHFVYQSQSHAAALADIRRALDRRDGFVVVTGDTGSGKTMLCRALVQRLDPACVSLVLDPRVTVEDLLRHVLADFGVLVAPHGPAPGRHQLKRALQRCLAALVPTGACAVLIIDDAQHLDPGVLLELCLLLNLETNESKLLQVVLVGHTSLRAVLERPELDQLNQRVTRRCVLEALSPGEVGEYILHRLSMAQRLGFAAGRPHALGTGDVTVERVPCNLSFTPAAVRALVRHSRGIPRLVNLLCDRALDIGYERRTHVIRWSIVRAAARCAVRGTAGRGAAGGIARRRSAAVSLATGAAIAALTVGAAGAGVWQATAVGGAAWLPGPPPAFARAAVWGAPPELGRVEVFDRLEIWNGALAQEPHDAGSPADPRLLGVALLRQGAEVTLALEMSAEPRRAVLHAVSDRILELETGSVAGPVRREQLAPVSEVPLVTQLSIRERRTPTGTFVGVRLMLRAPGRGDVRVAGRVVYVDIQPVDGSRQPVDGSRQPVGGSR